MEYKFADCRNLDEYPRGDKSTPMEMWKWGFKRRCPEYQEDFAEFKDSHPHDVIKNYHYAENTFLNLFGKPKDEKTKKRWFYGNPTIREYLVIRYGIDGGKFIDPVREEPPRFFNSGIRLDRFPSNFWDPYNKTYTWEPDHDLQVAIVFDLSKSVPEQLKIAKDILKHRKEFYKGSIEETILRPADWQIYLRLLDAVAEGMSRQEIAHVLFNHDKYTDSVKQMVHRCITKAKELRDGDF